MDVAVGDAQIDFLADEPAIGHFTATRAITMNAMGHDMPTMIGVLIIAAFTGKSPSLSRTMAMKRRHGMNRTEMEMPLPDEHGRMMTGKGPLARSVMGGMFSMVKVRRKSKPARLLGSRFGTSTRLVKWRTRWTGSLPDPARFRPRRPQQRTVQCPSSACPPSRRIYRTETQIARWDGALMPDHRRINIPVNKERRQDHHESQPTQATRDLPCAQSRPQ